jgi:hypothetical protein
MKSKNMAEYMKARRLERRQQLLVLAGNECRVCKSTDNLEFNHIDRSSKLITLSGKGLDGRWETILEELDKCELLCNNCHLDKTREQYRNKEIRPWNDKKHLPYLHGTARCYSEKACRCEECRNAKKLYRAKLIDYWKVVDKQSQLAKR